MTHQQLALGIQLNHHHTWNEFIWKKNSFIKQQLTLTLSGHGEKILYLWGEPGSGKSHLLQALCQQDSPCQAMYLPLHLLKECGPESIENISAHTVLVDDLDVIAGHAAWESALFNLFNTIHDDNSTILIISNAVPPAQSLIQLPDLHSRLNWALVMQLEALDDENKIVCLQQQAIQRGFHLPHTVATFLIHRHTRNMQQLISIIDTLDRASLAAQRKITIPFIKSIFP